MEDYYEYLDSNGVTTLYKLIKDDTVALIDSYSVTINGITTNLDNHINNTDIHTPITDIESMVDTKISGLVNSAPETLDTLKELSDALGNDPNFATTIANQIGSKANSVHSHVVSDITNFPTIPTKTSQLINDSGYITSISWTNVTDKPNFSTVATSGSYTDLSNTPTIPTKVSQLENDTGFINALTDVVDTKSNQTINGVKTFNNAIVQKQDGCISNGNIDITTTPSSNLFTHFFFSDKNNVANAFIRYAQRTNGINEINLFVRDKDLNNYGVSVNTNNEFIPVLNNTYSLGSAGAKWKKIYSDDIVHTTGDEYIDGNKVFRNSITVYNTLYRRNNNADITVTPTSAVTSSFAFLDKNSKHLGYIEHIQRTSGVNDIGIYVADKNSSFHGIQITSNNEVLPVSNNTYSLGSSSYKWAKIYSNDVVHTSGTETIAGIKTFTNTTISNKELHYKDTQYDWSDTSLDTWCNAGHVSWYDKAGNRRMHELVGATGGVWRKACYINENQYFSVDSNRNISFSGTTTFNGNLTASKFIGNLQGNANTATKSSYLDNYSAPGMNKIYLDWDNQVKSYVGLKVDNTTMGGLITTNNIGSQTAKSATYSTTPATTDNSTRIATTAWVRTYVNSVAGSNTVGSSVSAYWSNSSNVTATGQASSGGYYPACYSEYITKTPVVGTIYSGAQLYTVLNAYAYAKGSLNNSIYVTNNTAQATFSSPISFTGKYLCTTANTVKFRAYTAQGSSSAVGTSSVVNNSSAKSIFIRVE